MIDDDDLVPGTSLMESMRALGYTFNSAVSDIIDNSISESATTISISFTIEPEPSITIFDDGNGMSVEDLRVAMRLGTSEDRERGAKDLGRFGLGLKTASLSQCRKLLVVTKQKGGEAHARLWSMDLIKQTGKWLSPTLSDVEISELPHVEELSKVASGTLVIWQDLDQLVEKGRDPADEILSALSELESHLALTFHRFLNGEGVTRLDINIGSTSVEGSDPFLRKHPSTQHLPEEILTVDGTPVRIRPYILPHISKLTSADKKRAHIDGSMRENQGFYIYRNNRLIGPSSWFNIARKAELTKFARGSIDIPNSLDHRWKLDVKKSTATPPEAVKQAIRRIIARFAEGSYRVNRFRGRAIEEDQSSRIWNVFKTREGFEYRINESHPLVLSLLDVNPELDQDVRGLIRGIEVSLPAQDIYNRLSADERIDVSEVDDETLILLIETLRSVIGSDTSSEEFYERLQSTDPFIKNSRYVEFAKNYLGIEGNNA